MKVFAPVKARQIFVLSDFKKVICADTYEFLRKAGRKQNSILSQEYLKNENYIPDIVVSKFETNKVFEIKRDISVISGIIGKNLLLVN